MSLCRSFCFFEHGAMTNKFLQHITRFTVIAVVVHSIRITAGTSLSDNVIYAKIGEDATLRCPFEEGHESVLIQLVYLKDDDSQVLCLYDHKEKKVEECNKNFCNRSEVSEKTGQVLIKIKQVKLSDSGKYNCKILNGRLSIVTMELKVSETSLSVIYANIGEDATLSCPFEEGHESVLIQLLYLKDDDSQVLCLYDHKEKKVEGCSQNFCNRSEVSEKTGKVLIKIKQVKLSDSGKYHCKILNGHLSVVTMELKVSDVGTTMTSGPQVVDTALELQLKNQHGMTTEQDKQDNKKRSHIIVKIVIPIIMAITAAAFVLSIIILRMTRLLIKDSRRLSHV
ncbi:uncharacterized protein LOC122813711 isoform X3 [Protopterus annectens]|uniref:uncharacterized protein LOC122813711 isoform X3 n=1 Tax=Protopterus annectens TaxID=7888 RepID=UPI001CF937E2|nr:uncharacterized protein LOC122813711 isoform X3 [Protopterus annectens]